MKLALLLLVALLAGAASATHCDHDDGHCMDHKTVCFGHRVHRCPHDCSCSGKWKGCPPSATTTCRGRSNYQCVDDRTFCLAGKRMACADGTWCRTTGTNRISPCNRTSPPRCHGANMACMDSKHFCQNGRRHRCPSGHVCHGSGLCMKPM